MTAFWLNLIAYFFWILIFLVFYVYFGYPLLLKILVAFRFRKKTTNYHQDSSGRLPRTTMIISAFNEEGIIEDKIKNSLDLNYPKDMLEIMVVSDGSTDQTNQIVRKYENSGVRLIDHIERMGKTACLNHAVPLAAGDIIVFSDANSRYETNALRLLVAHFIENDIGFVTGWTKYSSKKSDNNTTSIGLYARLEAITKKLESDIGCCVGADGAIFAIRKHLYRQLDETDINDLVIPFDIIKQGYRGILEPRALCIEEAADDSSKEFSRQVRIMTRTIRAIGNNYELLNPFKYGFFSLQFFSHKCMKFFLPVILILLFISNMALVNQGGLYLALFLSQIAFYGLSLLGYLWSKRGTPPRILSVPETFVLVNLATLNGWKKILKGESYTVWTTVRSA